MALCNLCHKRARARQQKQNVVMVGQYQNGPGYYAPNQAQFGYEGNRL